MEKQTAVEWMAEQLIQKSRALKIMLNAHKEIIEQAKQIEKSQLEDSYCFGILDSGEDGLGFNHYYNETFKSE